MNKKALIYKAKEMIAKSLIPEEMKETYLGILPFLPEKRIEKMLFLLQKEQMILTSA
jgi:hypothetical protein